jgi:aminopeptidase N
LAAALKDPFFRIRIQALELMDLSNPEQMKALGAEVEKLASNDPKTLTGCSYFCFGKNKR